MRQSPSAFRLPPPPTSCRRVRSLFGAIAAGVAITAVTLSGIVIPPGSASAAERPPVMGRNGGVSAGHPLTTAAAFEVLLRGGNAFDAGVAALLVGGVVEQDLYSLGGEGLVLVYPRGEHKVTAVVGQGWAPQGATIDAYDARGKTLAGAGLDPAVVPGTLHAALTVLEKWGTMSFEQVAARAIEYAGEGFPLRPRTVAAIARNAKFIAQWPDNQRYWVKPDGTAYRPGDTIKFPTLANTLTRMVEAERAHKAEGRAAGVAAARDRFYKGDIAQEMVGFLKAHDAPFELADFAEFYARIEAPSVTTYRGYEVYKHSFGGQGPVLLQALNILENFDLRAMKLNSPEYLHTVVEALKLAYADRNSYYGDPAFVRTPGEGLLSKAYAKERAKLIDPKNASRAFVAGNPFPYDSQVKDWPYWVADIKDTGPRTGPLPDPEPVSGSSRDTTHIAIIDRDGNMFELHPKRRLDRRRRHPRRHRHRHERARRAVLARQNPRRAAAPPRAPPLHAHPLAGAARRRAVHGDRLAGRRQPGPDHFAGLPRHRRVLARLVSKSARGVRMAAGADATLLRFVLAAQFRLQQAQCRGQHPGRGLQRTCGARARRRPHPRLRDERLRHRGADRTGDWQPHRRRRPAAGLLRDRVLNPNALRVSLNG